MVVADLVPATLERLAGLGLTANDARLEALLEAVAKAEPA
jgi:hypothetical protein